MALTDQEFEEIKKLYGDKDYRMLTNAKNIPTPIQFFRIENINLNYSFDPNIIPKTWWESGVVVYNQEAKEDFGKVTYSPEPDFTNNMPNYAINKNDWLKLMQDENQTGRDIWDAEYVKPTDWGYKSKSNEFLFKKALLAIDVSKRYEAWGDRMYNMFKAQNPTHAKFFLQTNNLHHTALMLSYAYVDLDAIDLKALNTEQLEFWAKLMLYVVDKKVALSEAYSPSYMASEMDTRDWAYKKIRSSALPPELIKLMIPPETKEEQGYLSQATSFLGSMVSSGLGFLPGYRAQQDAKLQENEKLLTTKIESLNQQLNAELQKISTDKPIKIVNTIVGKINELLIHITLQKIDATNSSSANDFITTNFTNALNYFNQVPAKANITILEKAQAACDAFKECYARSSALLKRATTNDEIVHRIDALHKNFTDRINPEPQEQKKLR